MKNQCLNMARTIGTLGLLGFVALSFGACKKKNYIGGNYGAGLMSVEASNTQEIAVKDSYDVYREGKSRQMNVDVGTNAALGLSLADATVGVAETSTVPVGAHCTVTLSYGRGAENGQATADVVLCKDQKGECGTMEDWGPKEKCLSLTNNVSTQLVRLPGGDCGFSLDRWTATMKGIAFAAGHPTKQGATLSDEDPGVDQIPVGSAMYRKTAAATTDVTASIGDTQIVITNGYKSTYTLGSDGAALSLEDVTSGGSSTQFVSVTDKNGAFLQVFVEGSDSGDNASSEADFGLVDRDGHAFDGKAPQVAARVKGLGLTGGDVSSGPAGTFKLACDAK